MKFSSDDLKYSDDLLHVYKKEDKNIKIYANGSFDYTYDKKNVNNNKKEMKISDKECRKKAEEFMFSNNILDDSCVYSDMGNTVIEEIGVEGSETIISKEVYFTRKINNKKVKGSRAAVVSIDADGDILQISTNYSSVEKKIKPNRIITIEEAIENAKKLEGMICMDEKTNKVVIESVEVVYWEDSSFDSKCNTIQPVYKINGKSYENNNYLGKFVAYEQAVH